MALLVALTVLPCSSPSFPRSLPLSFPHIGVTATHQLERKKKDGTYKTKKQKEQEARAEAAKAAMLAAGLEGKAEVSILWEVFSSCLCFVFLLILLLLLPIAISDCFLLRVVWCVDAFPAAAFAISRGKGRGC